MRGIRRRGVAALALVLVSCSGSPAPTPVVSPSQAVAPSLASSEPSPATSSPPPSASHASPSPSASPHAHASDPVAFWTRLGSAGGRRPAAREDHTWTVDASGRQAYMFGGRANGRVFDDLWRFDLERARWRRVAQRGPGPAARFGHTATWVDGVGLVIWSGQAGSRFFDDLWAFEPGAGRWRRLEDGGRPPAARYGSCAALGPDGRLWVSHGFTDSGRFGDTRAYDFRAGRWQDETPRGDAPVVRCLHDCLWSPDGRLVLYAGQTDGAPALGDLWTFEATKRSWSRARDPEPPPRNLYALASLGDHAVVFGGQGQDRQGLDDVWLVDLAELSWTRAERFAHAPAPRWGSTLVSDPARDRLLLFGGRDSERAFGDVWELSLDTGG